MMSITHHSFSSRVSAMTVKDFSVLMIWKPDLISSVSARGFNRSLAVGK